MKQHLYESEVRNMEKVLKWQLPPAYKTVGLIGALLVFIGLMLNKVLDPDIAILSSVLKNFLLAFLLVMSVSRDREEDEMIVHLRARSYQLAFVCGVAYTLIQPLVNFGVDTLISMEQVAYDDLAITQVMFFMLAVQLATFHVMKKIN